MTDLSKLDEYFVDLIRIEGDLVIFNHWKAGEIQVPVSEVILENDGTIGGDYVSYLLFKGKIYAVGPLKIDNYTDF